MPKTDYTVKKLEKGPLQRFRNQNAVLKKFGEKGLRLYKAANGKLGCSELCAELGIEPDFADEVAGWLEEQGMAEIIGERSAGKREPGEKVAAEEKEEEAPEEAPAPEEKIEPAPRPRSRLRDLVEQEMEKKESGEEIVPVEEEKAVEEQEAKEAKEEPEESKAESKEETQEAEEEIVPISPEEESAGESEGRWKGAGKKSEDEEPKEGEEGSEEKTEEPQEDEEVQEPGKAEEPIGPEQDDPEQPKDRDEEEPGIEPEEQRESDPVRKIILDKYGEIGLKVYSLIDGQKNAEEIMNETGVSEAKLIEMLEFMEKQGIIKLEHPESRPAPESEEEKDRFSPLEDSETGTNVRDPNPVEMATKLQGGIFKDIEMRAKVALKYGEKGTKVFDALGKGGRTDIDLSMDLRMPVYEVRNILSFLAGNKAVIMRPLDRKDVVKMYGEDSVSIYKRYGREGVLLYELIGKDMGIKQMAQIVTTEKEKFAEMFIFAHKVLGVEIPIDKDVIYSQLGK
ncbi:MAG: hypothetical protein WC488_04805 [Candidatus Micrarchaeia archaeon]